MKKKNYIKPCMYTYEIEPTVILAGSGEQPTTKPVSGSQNFSVNDVLLQAGTMIIFGNENGLY